MSMYCIVSEALPFLGGGGGGEGQNVHMYFTSQCGAPFAWGGGGVGQNVHVFY